VKDQIIGPGPVSTAAKKADEKKTKLKRPK
jgi:hypothetical protein